MAGFMYIDTVSELKKVARSEEQALQILESTMALKPLDGGYRAQIRSTLKEVIELHKGRILAERAGIQDISGEFRERIKKYLEDYCYTGFSGLVNAVAEYSAMCWMEKEEKEMGE